jgi:hypothetical protein
MNRFWRRIAAAALVTGLGLANAATQSGYMREAARQDWTDMLAALRSLTALPPHVPIMIGLQDFPKPDLVALYTSGHPTWNLSGAQSVPTSLGKTVQDPEFRDLLVGLFGSYRLLKFDLGPDGPRHDFKRFEAPGGLSTQSGYVVLPARNESVVNGSQDRPAGGQLYAALRADQHDTLVQIDTSLAHIIVPGVTDNVGLWQLEGDFAGSPGGLQGLGRHVLFEVLNPVPGSRFLLDYSTLGLAGQGFSLPAAAVTGTERLPLEFEGQGAGRVLSAPITPREIDGHFYIALDMGADAARFPSERHGLAALYNGQLHADSRHLVGFARNISLLTPEQVAAIDPPAAISRFPAGLFDPGLLYSGVTEDGWLADKAWFELGLPGPSNFVHVTGDVPGFSPKILGGTVSLLVDGVKVAEGKLMGGAIDLTIPIREASGPREIEFDISGADRIPAPDGRLVSIHLTSLSLGRRGEVSPVPKPSPPQ